MTKRRNVLGLLAVIHGAGAVFLSLVLVICKMPWLGPMLYAFVMPVAVLAVGLALGALPTVVLPLAAWAGLRRDGSEDGDIGAR